MNLGGSYNQLVETASHPVRTVTLLKRDAVPYRWRFSRGVAKALYVLLRRANIVPQVSYDAIRHECEEQLGKDANGLSGDLSSTLAHISQKFNVNFALGTYEEVKAEILSRPVSQCTFVAELHVNGSGLQKIAQNYLATEVITAETIEGTTEGADATAWYTSVATVGDGLLKVNTNWSANAKGNASALIADEVAKNMKFLIVRRGDGARAHFPSKSLPDDFFTGIAKMNFDDLQLDRSSKPLGVGSYGAVYAAELEPHDMIAVKVMDVSKVDPEILLHELAFPCFAPNIVHCFGYAQKINKDTNKMEIFIAMEVLGQTLSTVLDQLRGKTFSALHLDLAKDILNGVVQLEEAGLVHRDLKPSNFLFSPTGLKIADLGSAAAAAMHRAATKLSSADNLPPEALTKSSGIATTKATSAWDVFSVGIILRQLVTRETIQQLNDLRAQTQNFSLVPSEYKPDGELASTAVAILAIANRCTCDNPADRPTASQVLKDLHAL